MHHRRPAYSAVQGVLGAGDFVVQAEREPARTARLPGIAQSWGSSEAMVSHVGGFMQKWVERFLACVDVTRFVVYGDPSPAARELLDGFGAEYLGRGAASRGL